MRVPRGWVLALAAMGVLGAVGAALVGPGTSPGAAPGLARAPEPEPAVSLAPESLREPLRAPTPRPTPPDPEVGAPEVGVLRVRVPGGIAPEQLDRAAAIADVRAVTLARSGTVGLSGSRRADGTVVERFTDGFALPMSVTALDPVPAAAALAARDPDGAAILGGLDPGEVILTRSAAEGRDLAAGDQVDLLGRPGLRVIGIVADGALRRSELAVHRDDADALGLATAGSITVLHDAAPGAATNTLVAALEGLAVEGPDVQVSRPDTDRTGRAPLVLSLPELKATFGAFAYRPRPGVREIDIDPTFVAEHIGPAQVPLLGDVRCHERIVDDLRAALDELVGAGLGGWIDPARYGGCFHARRIGVGRDRLSSHSWGAAVDINVDLSMPGLGPVPPDEMIVIFGRHGFRWGGDFTTPDHHHWEWVGERATERRER